MPHKSWLEQQSDALRYWLQNGSCPLVVSVSDGGFLWANRAAEDLLGYALIEFVGNADRQGLSWIELTVDARDLAADLAMVRSLEEGERESFSIQKGYRHKSGRTIPCDTHIMRWPVHDAPVEFFLCTLIPIGAGSDYLVKELVKMRKLLLDIGARMEAADPSEHISHRCFDLIRSAGTWATENKVAAACVLLFLYAAWRGKEAIEIAEAIRAVFLGTTPEPPTP